MVVSEKHQYSPHHYPICLHLLGVRLTLSVKDHESLGVLVVSVSVRDVIPLLSFTRKIVGRYFVPL